MPRHAGTYKEEDFRRLATPRAGYSAHGAAAGPAKKAAHAVVKRDAYLRETGYIDNPKELLRVRFHGTSAEQERAQNSARLAAQKAAADSMTEEQQRRLFRNCWRTGRPIPAALQQLVHDDDEDGPTGIQMWREARLPERPQALSPTSAYNS